MKVIEGKRYYAKTEVASLVGRSPQTIHLWHKWSDYNEAHGESRLIPAPLRLDNGYRYWSEEDVSKIKRFADTIEYGDLREHSRRQWHKD